VTGPGVPPDARKSSDIEPSDYHWYREESGKLEWQFVGSSFFPAVPEGESLGWDSDKVSAYNYLI
jgi:hypothetical protein